MFAPSMRISKDTAPHLLWNAHGPTSRFSAFYERGGWVGSGGRATVPHYGDGAALTPGGTCGEEQRKRWRDF